MWQKRHCRITACNEGYTNLAKTYPSFGWLYTVLHAYYWLYIVWSHGCCCTCSHVSSLPPPLPSLHFPIHFPCPPHPPISFSPPTVYSSACILLIIHLLLLSTSSLQSCCYGDSRDDPTVKKIEETRGNLRPLPQLHALICSKIVCALHILNINWLLCEGRRVQQQLEYAEWDV